MRGTVSPVHLIVLLHHLVFSLTLSPHPLSDLQTGNAAEIAGMYVKSTCSLVLLDCFFSS